MNRKRVEIVVGVCVLVPLCATLPPAAWAQKQKVAGALCNAGFALIAKKAVPQEMQIAEDIQVQRENPAGLLNSHTGNDSTNNAGQFSDFLALGNNSNGPQSGHYAVLRQIFTTSSRPVRGARKSRASSSEVRSLVRVEPKKEKVKQRGSEE